MNKKEEEMEIIKRYKGSGELWHETTIKDCIEHTEGGGYWKNGTVKEMLKEGVVVYTPFCVYKKKERENE